MGSWSGECRRTQLWLTTATGGPPGPSRHSIARPRSTRAPSRSKNSGVTPARAGGGGPGPGPPGGGAGGGGGGGAGAGRGQDTDQRGAGYAGDRLQVGREVGNEACARFGRLQGFLEQ